jgi:hypothetical protein
MLGGDAAPCEFDAPAFGTPAFDAPAFDAPAFGAAAAKSGSGRGLLTRGVAEDRGIVDGGIVDGGIADEGIAGDGAAVGAGFCAARGVARSVGGALPGPNAKTWPTEMRKSAPILFHRAKSRKSRSCRQAML